MNFGESHWPCFRLPRFVEAEQIARDFAVGHGSPVLRRTEYLCIVPICGREVRIVRRSRLRIRFDRDLYFLKSRDADLCVAGHGERLPRLELLRTRQHGGKTFQRTVEVVVA